MKGPRRYPQKNKDEKLINGEITARELVVVDENGEKIGQFSRIEALKMAEERELDLVEMG